MMRFKRRAAAVASIVALTATVSPGIATAQSPLDGLLGGAGGAAGGAGTAATAPSATGAGAGAATGATGAIDNSMGLDLLGPLLGSGVTQDVRDPYAVAESGVSGTSSAANNRSSGSSSTTGTTVGMNRDADAEYQQALEGAMEGEIDTKAATKIASGLTTMLPIVMSTAAQPTTIEAVTSGATCGIGLGTAAAGMMASGAAVGATGGAGAAAAGPAMAAAAPVAAAAAPHCITATGGLMTSAGMLVAAYEDNPDLPQLVDVAAQLDPDSGLGKVAWENMPAELQTEENKAALKTFSNIAYNMSKVKLGQSLQAYGEVVYGIGKGDPSSITQLVPVTLTLGTNLISAGSEGISGQPLAMSIPGLTDVTSPRTTPAAQSAVASKRQVSDSDLNKVEKIGSSSDDSDVDDNRSSRNGSRSSSSERSTTQRSTTQRSTSTRRTTSSSEPTSSRSSRDSDSSGRGGDSGNSTGNTGLPAVGSG